MTTDTIPNYTPEYQELFLSMMLSDPTLYSRVSNIMNVDNFHKSLRPAAEFLVQYSKEYKSIPDPIKVKVSTGIHLEKVDTLKSHDIEWFFDNFERFTRRNELERAIRKAGELLEKGDFTPVEKLVTDAVKIGLTKDMGTDYWGNPKDRLMAIKSSNGQISTGWPALDKVLYGGFNRGELNIFAGPSGSGKSLFMQNIALNWAQSGLNGVYITLELAEELCCWRMDSMLTDIAAKDVFKRLEEVDLAVRIASKKAGKFQVKELPAQSTMNDVRAYIDTYQIETGIRVDFICIDYLDLLMPMGVKVSPGDHFTKDKYVSEEIRNYARETGVLMVTASQLNRSAVEETEYNHSHISGGISKINSSDNVFGIHSTMHMRDRGQVQLQGLKTRNSDGFGKKVDLSYNPATLRIYDDGDEEKFAAPTKVASDVMNQIRSSSNVEPVKSPDFKPPLKPIPESDQVKMKSLLNNLRSQNGG